MVTSEAGYPSLTHHPKTWATVSLDKHSFILTLQCFHSFSPVKSKITFCHIPNEHQITYSGINVFLMLCVVLTTGNGLIWTIIAVCTAITVPVSGNTASARAAKLVLGTCRCGWGENNTRQTRNELCIPRWTRSHTWVTNLTDITGRASWATTLAQKATGND